MMFTTNNNYNNNNLDQLEIEELTPSPVFCGDSQLKMDHVDDNLNLNLDFDLECQRENNMNGMNEIQSDWNMLVCDMKHIQGFESIPTVTDDDDEEKEEHNDSCQTGAGE